MGSVLLVLAACGGPADMPRDTDTGTADSDPQGDSDPIPVDTDWICAPDASVCDGVCTAVLSDPQACGACDSSCADGQVCEDGQCLAPARADPCDTDTVANVLAPATAEAGVVDLDCSLDLGPDDVITKNLRLLGTEASGVTIDCGGGTIRRTVSTGGSDVVQILSRKRGETTWERPTDVTIRDCRIEGSIRVLGQGLNGEGEDVQADSVTPGHRERAQQAAPTRVLLDRLDITGQGRIPVYLAPGTTGVTLRDSQLDGRTVSVVVYLDAESARNRILGNTFDVTMEGSPLKREVIAVDGSADNVIAGNTLAQPTTGGVFVYRNCGEGGTVRHQHPRRNTITGNTFAYPGGPSAPAVWVGSRVSSGITPSFCPLDDGYGFGSSASDEDFARNTVIVGNRLAGPAPDPAFAISDEPTLDTDNEVSDTPSAPRSVCVQYRANQPPRVWEDGAVVGDQTCDGGVLR